MKQNVDRLVCKPQGSRIPSKINTSMKNWNGNTCSQRSFHALGGSWVARDNRAGPCVKAMLCGTQQAAASPKHLPSPTTLPTNTPDSPYLNLQDALTCSSQYS